MKKVEMINKKEIETRWSKSLVQKYFPVPSLTEEKKGFYGSYTVHSYSMKEIKKIERRKGFQEDFLKTAKRKEYYSSEKGKEMLEKRQEKIKKKNITNALSFIDIKSIEDYITKTSSKKLIKDACKHYNEIHYDDNVCANPKDFIECSELDEESKKFIIRITSNYIRHNISYYNFYAYKGKQYQNTIHREIRETIEELVRNKFEEKTDK